MPKRIKFDGNAEAAVISAEALSAFAVYGKGIPYSPVNTAGEIIGADISLEQRIEIDGIPVILCGTAEAVTHSAAGYAVMLTVNGCRRTDRTDAYFAESARLALLGHLWCISNKAEAVTLRLVLQGKEPVVHEYSASAEYIEAAVTALLRRATPFIRHIYLRGKEGFPALRELPFPYGEMREAQYEFITEAFRTIKSSSRLLVSAPTGTGKTISALYPAVRAIGEGICDKVFCLCAKTTIGKSFTDAAALLSAHAPMLRCVVISSKERCCPMRDVRGTRRSRICKNGCGLYGFTDKKCAELRLIEAAAECLDSAVILADTIKTIAEKHCVCPHELSLLVSEYCDIVVCDYNYVFDFRMRLRRYFEEDSEENFVFLADEVHNLPKRASDTYSAQISLDTVSKLLANAEKLREENALVSVLCGFRNELEAVRASTLKDGESREIDGKTIKAGFSSTSALPQKIAESAGVLRRTLGTVIMKYGDALPPIFSEAAEDIGKFCHVCSLFDRNYTCFTSAIGDEFYLRLCCLDPSPLLDLAMTKARAVIFFSATLTPISYYADILGCGRGGVLELDSPFPRENLCPVAVDSVSMKLSERGYAADTVAECIAAVAEANPGNYLAFFPSFDYMEKVLKLFHDISPDTKVVVQERSMKTSAREKFLDSFKCENDGFSSLVGFAVLGGIFSEGIDLPGDSLIGVIIAGTGMPAITSERNIMKEYFDLTREGGMEYAYIYPGFNSVLQAAGRVIRTDTDRGVLVLIDSRYAEPGYYKLFPKYWRHIKYTGDAFSLEEILRRFWDE
ncbi:MAG: ATP-dependent DNA helicase [Ruminococcaceae bacterium]|nr:ATP-dependent DNA helicase [Oscillospiraceae bacterium]